MKHGAFENVAYSIRTLIPDRKRVMGTATEDEKDSP